jgi:hypothetical protein
MPYFIRALFLIAVVSLSGCFDFTQEIWVNQDGSGRLQYGIKLHKGLSAFSREFNLKKDPCVLFFRDREDIEKKPGVVSAKISNKTEKELTHCIMDIVVDDFSRLNELQDEVLRDNKTTRQKDDFNTRFNLHNKENGLASFTQTLGSKDNATDSNEDEFDREAHKFANMMFLSVLQGSFWSVKLNAPEITSANGKISEDKTSVVWNIQMSDILIKQDMQLELQAELDFDPPWYRRLWKWVN